MGKFSGRILIYLEWAEAHESDRWLQDDYRQAWIVVLLADRGLPFPFVTASYIMYGLHPNKLWPAIMARRRAKLGPLYSQFFPAPLPALPPKKPPQSERQPVAPPNLARRA